MVEEPQPATSDVRNDPVEHAAALLIGVEAVPQKMPQAAAALRRPKGERPIDQWLPIVAEQRVLLAARIFERRDNVANARQTGPLHQRSFGFIDDLINPARLQAAS